MTAFMSILGLCLFAASCRAEPVGPARALPLPSLKVPHAAVSPKVSAELNDPAWAEAARIPALRLHVGVSEKFSPVPTEVCLLWNEDAVYVRFVCTDTEIYMPYNGPDAPLYKGDVVEVFVDPKGDGRHYMEVEVNPANSVLDCVHLLTTEPKSNEVGMLVDGVRSRDHWTFMEWSMRSLKTAARVLEEGGAVKGWVADFALPAEDMLRRLGLRKFGPMILRFNFIRYEYVRSPEGASRQFLPMAWNPVQAGCPHISPEAMGTVELLPPAGAKP